MNKKLLLQLLVVSIFTGNQIQSMYSVNSVNIGNKTTKPIFVKNAMSLLKIGKSGIIGANQSENYDGNTFYDKGLYDGAPSYGILFLRIFNNTSNSGPYLYVQVGTSGTRVEEYNSFGTTITKSYYLNTRSSRDVRLYIHPDNSMASGLKVSISE